MLGKYAIGQIICQLKLNVVRINNCSRLTCAKSLVRLFPATVPWLSAKEITLSESTPAKCQRRLLFVTSETPTFLGARSLSATMGHFITCVLYLYV